MTKKQNEKWTNEAYHLIDDILEWMIDDSYKRDFDNSRHSIITLFLRLKQHVNLDFEE
jgi:hypothetical protein